MLGIAERAGENQAAAGGLLERLVEHGLDPKRRYMFVIDGSKTLGRPFAPCWGAAAFLITEKNFRKIQNYRGRRLKAVLNPASEENQGSNRFALLKPLHCPPI